MDVDRTSSTVVDMGFRILPANRAFHQYYSFYHGDKGSGSPKAMARVTMAPMPISQYYRYPFLTNSDSDYGNNDKENHQDNSELK